MLPFRLLLNNIICFVAVVRHRWRTFYTMHWWLLLYARASKPWGVLWHWGHSVFFVCFCVSPEIKVEFIVVVADITKYGTWKLLDRALNGRAATRKNDLKFKCIVPTYNSYSFVMFITMYLFYSFIYFLRPFTCIFSLLGPRCAYMCWCALAAAHCFTCFILICSVWWQLFQLPIPTCT